jgi:hypothetical protein
MKFFSTEGRIHKIDLRPSKWPRKSESECKSLFQFSIGEIIDRVFPNEIILEEFYIPGDKLYIDFLLPRKRIAVEAQGNQHYEYSNFFHGSQENFKLSQARDRKKSLWCVFNDIKLVTIREDDKEEIVVNKLLSD